MAVPGNLAVIWIMEHKIYFHNVLLIDCLCHTMSITNMHTSHRIAVWTDFHSQLHKYKCETHRWSFFMSCLHCLLKILIILNRLEKEICLFMAYKLGLLILKKSNGFKLAKLLKPLNSPRNQMLGYNYCNPNKDHHPPHLARYVPFSSKDKKKHATNRM